MVAMRRKDRQVSDEEAMAYLKAAEYGVLSTVGPDGGPYGVPLTYAVEEDGKGLVFHCARDGYKLACFAANPRAHFVAVQETNVLPEEFSIEYKSVMVSGLLGRGRQIFHHQLGRVRQPRRRQDPGVPPEYRAYFRQASRQGRRARHGL